MTEGSLSKQRALVVAQTRARLKNNEGSAFDYSRNNGSVQSKVNANIFVVFQLVISYCRCPIKKSRRDISPQAGVKRSRTPAKERYGNKALKGCQAKVKVRSLQVEIFKKNYCT